MQMQMKCKWAAYVFSIILVHCQRGEGVGGRIILQVKLDLKIILLAIAHPLESWESPHLLIRLHQTGYFVIWWIMSNKNIFVNCFCCPLFNRTLLFRQQKTWMIKGTVSQNFRNLFFSIKRLHIKHAFANFLVFAKLFDNKFRKLRVNDYERDYAYFHNFKLLRLIKQLS